VFESVLRLLNASPSHDCFLFFYFQSIFNIRRSRIAARSLTEKVNSRKKIFEEKIEKIVKIIHVIKSERKSHENAIKIKDEKLMKRISHKKLTN
jgi:1,2-phenylacetyl-CoA epoxidase PaaB subunit